MLSEEELQLKARLDRVLGQINAAPPPVAAVLRKGRIMRTGYNLAISTAVAAVSLAGFAAVTQLGHLHRHQASSGEPGRHPHWKKERVVRLGPVAKHGLVAEGIETGSGRQATWKIRVDASHNQVRAKVTGGREWYIGNLRRSVNPGSIGTFYYGGIEGWPGFYAVVSKDVTRVAVTTKDHQKLDLYPVAAAGRRWVGVLTPLSDSVRTFTAYSGKTELGRVVTDHLPVTWWPPGQKIPAEQNVVVNRGRVPAGSGHHLDWVVSVQYGSDGYCVLMTGYITGSGGFGIEDCMSPDTAQSAGVKAIEHRRLGSWLLGTAKRSVAYLKFDLGGGRASRVAAVPVSGQRFFGLALRSGQHVASWAAYDKAGHKLYGGTGLPKIDRYIGPLTAWGWADNTNCVLGQGRCPKL
ncbi:MAG TPA: hypothetical protein VN767_17955 [Streptosporangiaceae bacterium]|nr:hypothetical protein [Streptosporangiaceae bacterium]